MVFYFTPAGSEFTVMWLGSSPVMEAQPDAIIRADLPSNESGMAAVNRGRELYDANLDLINAIAASICRSKRLNATDAADFTSQVHIKLLDNECEVLNKFQGRSKLKTFLQVVITHAFLDYRNAEWGKPRPSNQAKRLGPRAIEIERLHYFEGMNLNEVFEYLRTNLRWDITVEELDRIVAQLPPRTRRRHIPDDVLTDVPDGGPSVDDIVAQRQLEEPRCRLLEALDRAIATFSTQDRLILTYHYHDGRSVAWIARTMKLDQPRLYKRRATLGNRLRKILEAQDFDRDTVRKLLDCDRL